MSTFSARPQTHNTLQVYIKVLIVDLQQCPYPELPPIALFVYRQWVVTLQFVDATGCDSALFCLNTPQLSSSRDADLGQNQANSNPNNKVVSA